MPTRSCIISCRSCWILNGFSRVAPRSKGASALRGRGLDLRARRSPDRAVLLGEVRRVLAGALAEDEQVGQRVAAEPIGAVDARARTRRRRTGPARVDICVSASTRTPPIM